jgi:hypothetical protein
VIAAPPVLPAVNEMIAAPSLAAAEREVGALAAIAAIAVVTAEVPTILPVPFVAVTTERTNFPASASVNTYVADVAPDIATHVDSSLAEVHRCQVYARLGVGVPVKVTAEVKVLPLTKVPVGADVADTCGATGVSVGVADVELEDAEEVPPVFVAVEVKVYAVPLVNPDTTQDPDAPVTVHVFPAKTPEESEA